MSAVTLSRRTTLRVTWFFLQAFGGIVLGDFGFGPERGMVIACESFSDTWVPLACANAVLRVPLPSHVRELSWRKAVRIPLVDCHLDCLHGSLLNVSEHSFVIARGRR